MKNPGKEKNKKNTISLKEKASQVTEARQEASMCNVDKRKVHRAGIKR